MKRTVMILCVWVSLSCFPAFAKHETSVQDVHFEFPGRNESGPSGGGPPPGAGELPAPPPETAVTSASSVAAMDNEPDYALERYQGPLWESDAPDEQEAVSSVLATANSASAQGSSAETPSFLFVVTGKVSSVDSKTGQIVVEEGHEKKEIYVEEMTAAGLREGTPVQAWLKPGSNRAEKIEVIA